MTDEEALKEINRQKHMVFVQMENAKQLHDKLDGGTGAREIALAYTWLQMVHSWYSHAAGEFIMKYMAENPLWGAEPLQPHVLSHPFAAVSSNEEFAQEVLSLTDLRDRVGGESPNNQTNPDEVFTTPI